MLRPSSSLKKSPPMLPIGLAHRVRVRRDVVQGEVLRMLDVDLDESATGVRLRRQMLTAAEALRAE